MELVFKTMNMSFVVFCAVMMCSLVGGYQHFGGAKMASLTRRPQLTYV
jgi:hypothetical protein